VGALFRSWLTYCCLRKFIGLRWQDLAAASLMSWPVAVRHLRRR